MNRWFWLLVFFSLSSTCFADTILLKSGKTIEAKIVEKECDSGNTDACMSLATNRFSHGTIQEALVYWKKACEAEDLDGCYQLGHFSQPEGGESKLAIGKLKAFCQEKKYEACADLGNLIATEDQVESMRLLKLACDSDNINGCLSLGYRAKVDGDISTAEKAYQRACDLGDFGGCNSLKTLK